MFKIIVDIFIFPCLQLPEFLILFFIVERNLVYVFLIFGFIDLTIVFLYPSPIFHSQFWLVIS